MRRVLSPLAGAERGKRADGGNRKPRGNAPTEERQGRSKAEFILTLDVFWASVLYFPAFGGWLTPQRSGRRRDIHRR